MERIRVGEASARGSTGLFGAPISGRDGIRVVGVAIGKKLIGAVTRVKSKHGAVLSDENAGDVVIIFLGACAGNQIGPGAGLGIECAQDGFAVGIADVAKVKNSVVKHGARVIVPSPCAIRSENGEIRLGD